MRLLAALVLGLGFFIASAPRAEVVPFTGTIRVGFGEKALIVPTIESQASVSELGTEVTNLIYDAPNRSAVAIGEGGLIIQPTVFETFGITITAPNGGGLIGGVQLTGANGTGIFQGTPLRGAMPFRGIAKICLFSPCQPDPIAILTVTANGIVGAGGARFIDEDYGIHMTVIGAPWTTGTARIGTISSRGGPTSGGGLALVTPVFISTNIPAIAALPNFWRMVVDFVGDGVAKARKGR